MDVLVTFLGTAISPPTATRNLPSVYLQYDGEQILFDCGEGTQRQMLRFNVGFEVQRIFLTQFDHDFVNGLPGLLKSYDLNNRGTQLIIHTPKSAKRQVDSLTSMIDRPEFPIKIEEVDPPSTVAEMDGFTVESFSTGSQELRVGYVFQEADRRGRFDRERAEELGVQVGPDFTRLHNGESVELADGRIIEPDQVVGPERPGRRIVYTGGTRPRESVREAAADADLLIHDAGFTEQDAGRARDTNHSTAKEAAELAANSEVKRLALFGFSGRYGTNVDHVHEAIEAAPNLEVFGVDDGQQLEVPFPQVNNEYTPRAELREQTAESGLSEPQSVPVGPDPPTLHVGELESAIEPADTQPEPQDSAPDLSALRDRAEEEARDEVKVTKTSASQPSTEYSRSGAVKRYVKARANGYCEGCEEPAPFTSKIGEPYLHAHHVFELSGGGSDTPASVIALCPNCHYRVHHGENGEAYNERLREKVEHLEAEASAE